MLLAETKTQMRKFSLVAQEMRLIIRFIYSAQIQQIKTLLGEGTPNKVTNKRLVDRPTLLLFYIDKMLKVMWKTATLQLGRTLLTLLFLTLHPLNNSSLYAHIDLVLWTRFAIVCSRLSPRSCLWMCSCSYWSEYAGTSGIICLRSECDQQHRIYTVAQFTLFWHEMLGQLPYGSWIFCVRHSAIRQP